MCAAYASYCVCMYTVHINIVCPMCAVFAVERLYLMYYNNNNNNGNLLS